MDHTQLPAFIFYQNKLSIIKYLSNTCAENLFFIWSQHIFLKKHNLNGPMSACKQASWSKAKIYWIYRFFVLGQFSTKSVLFN